MATNAATLPFREQIDFFRQKVSVPTRAWTDVWREAHDTAFMVAGAYKADLLGDLRQAVDKAITGGTTLREFRADFDQIVARHGWQYKGSRGWRTRVIYETNLRTSYSAGRYKQLTDSAMLARRPYWIYEHSPASVHPRPLHLAWSGTVLEASDPWWSTHFTPNGWGCKCSVRALSRRDAEARGISEAPADGVREWTAPDGSAHEVPNGIDPGFDYAPGSTTPSEHARGVLASGADELPEALGSQLREDLAHPPPPLGDYVARGKAAMEGLSKGLEPARSTAGADAFSVRLRDEIERRAGAPHRIEVDGAAAELVGRAARRYPASWVVASDTAGRLRAGYSERGSCINAERGHALLAVPPGNLGAAVHELAHRFQFAMPELQQYFEELHIRRTTDASGVRHDLAPLSDLAEGVGYGPREVTRRDRYIDPYAGKEYMRGKSWERGPREVMPMTFQWLLGDRAGWLRRLLAEDPELAALGVGLLLHYRP